jgi:hypothetical protein
VTALIQHVDSQTDSLDGRPCQSCNCQTSAGPIEPARRPRPARGQQLATMVDSVIFFFLVPLKLVAGAHGLASIAGQRQHR